MVTLKSSNVTPHVITFNILLHLGEMLLHLGFCERFEPRSHLKSRLSLIVRVNVVLNRTVVVDSD